MNKKRLIITASLVLTVALVAAGITMAYLTSKPQAMVNHFGVGALTAEINENNNTTPNSSNSIVIANNVAPKLVQVENKAGENAIDAYVRVQLVPTLRDSSSNLGGNFPMTTPANNQIVFHPFTNKDLTITLVFDSGWNSKWKYRAGDNCFYYTDVVKPGTKTATLLQEVRFSGSDAAAWQTKFNLDVLTDSIQALGKTAGNTPAAQEAWPVSIDNSTHILTPNNP